MAADVSMRDRILDAAERRMRSVGYNAVSFRDLAQDVNIKSASVHYHFATKEDLGVALVDRYAARFGQRLSDIDTADALAAVTRFVGCYEAALSLGEGLCLCAVLGAEANGLPVSVRERVGAFFQLSIAWLAGLNARHGLAAMTPGPAQIVASLAGAMIVATSRADRALFGGVTQSILTAYRGKSPAPA